MNILFVCRSNSGRSQMAEAFLNASNTRHSAVSAGLKVAENGKEGKPLPAPVIECMSEIGINMSGRNRKQLTEQMVNNSDKVIVMADKEDIPSWLLNSPKLHFWEVDDASGQSLDFHRRIRDEIKTLVNSLVQVTA